MSLNYESMADGAEAATRRRFIITFSVVMTTGTAMVVLLAVWLTNFGNSGFGWDSKHIFSYHPLFMIVGVVFIYSKGALMYRLLHRQPKKIVKALHAGMNLLSLCMAIMGLVVVVTWKQSNGIRHLYSLHSWIGGTALLLLATQWAGGFLIFALPRASEATRAAYLRLHAFCGRCVLGLGCLAACIGLASKAAGIAGYSHLPASGVTINIVGLLLVTFTIGVMHLLTSRRYRRSE